MRIPNSKWLERARKFPPIRDIIGPMNLTAEAEILHLYLCYNTLGKQIQQLEHDELREADPMEALLAAVNLVECGDFKLHEREGEDGSTIEAIRVKK